VYQPTLQNTVVWAAMGNHEGYSSNGKTEDGPFYDAYVSPTGGEAGGVPSGTEAYFSFDYGNIHFICLDSHDLSRFPDGLMARWLEQDLRATEADWLIAYWHHPPYTKGTHDSDVELRQIEMREQIMPILEARGVDVVLTGHSHVYERSMLIDGAYSTPTTNVGVVLDDGDGHRDGDGAYRKSDGLNEHEGTAQIVTGHGGAGGVRRSGVMPIMRQTLLEHGSMIIDIEGDTLTSRMIGASGEIRDEFNLVKKGRVRPQVVEQPWSPVGPRFEPLGGPFPDGPVELSQSGYWAGAEIRYTVDGSEPTRHSELYTEPIVVSRDSGLVVLRARSFKDRKTQPTLSTQAIYKAYGADVPQARHPIVVDGEFDDWAQWQGEVIALGGDDFLGRSETWTDARDLSASVRLSWTPEGLYYAVSVVDDIYLPATHDMVVQSDSLMFMVDGRGPRHLSGPSLGHGAYRVMFAGNASGDGHRSVSYLPEFDGYEFATQRTADGYDAEFFVPFSEKLFPDQGFEVGRVIQASVVVVEHDEPGFTGVDGLYWGAVADWNIRTDPSFWKPMRLGE
ncbi:MAG: metallophosphoesterase, partial [Acidimicrobiales bacterium]